MCACVVVCHVCLYVALWWPHRGRTQGVPRLLPEDCLDRLQPPRDPTDGLSGRKWMDELKCQVKGSVEMAAINSTVNGLIDTSHSNSQKVQWCSGHFCSIIIHSVTKQKAWPCRTLLPASEECRRVSATSCCLLLYLLLNHFTSFHKSWISFYSFFFKWAKTF